MASVLNHKTNVIFTRKFDARNRIRGRRNIDSITDIVSLKAWTLTRGIRVAACVLLVGCSKTCGIWPPEEIDQREFITIPAFTYWAWGSVQVVFNASQASALYVGSWQTCPGDMAAINRPETVLLS